MPLSRHLLVICHGFVTTFLLYYGAYCYFCNVNGLRDGDKRLGFLQWLSHLSPSVVCLQETHAVSNDDLLSWFSRFGYLCAGSFGTNHCRGVVVLHRSVLECWSVVSEFDGRFVLVEFGLRVLFSVSLLSMLLTVIQIVTLFWFVVLTL